ncbi:protein I'm not dead yet-like [Hyposmocoma kahamanoa]|uniref:protein I'm not dead yet-like n=1 Tax=Hyposmocoma kahamanoa TaxID=1477025 RepID=UPI000E6DA1F0|nr:protein I'm not dead yet-like [Hyposmocoma kahamanoa]
MPKGKGTGEGGVLFKVDPRELHVTVWDRLTIFMAVHWRGLLAVVIPLSCISIITSPIPPAKHQWVGYTLVVMALYWMTECIPLPVTSLLPLFIFPATGVMSTLNTIQCYVNDTIFLFIGSLFLASAIEQSGLHKRFALCFIRTIGYSHYKILFAMCFVTMFVSMWITNTAATTMMVPINFAILRVFEDQKLLKIYNTNIEGEQYASSITVCYFCAASFSATIGNRYLICQ